MFSQSMVPVYALLVHFFQELCYLWMRLYFVILKYFIHQCLILWTFSPYCDGSDHLVENFFFFLSIVFIYLFMAVLGLCSCARAFSTCGKRGPLFIAARRPLTIAASLVAEPRLQTRRPSNCGSRAQLLRGTWDLPRPGLEPVSPALAGRFSTTAPPGKPWWRILTSVHFKFYRMLPRDHPGFARS